MISTEHTQSLSDFRRNAGETLDRLSKTGEAEILTVNGEARAVLLSPVAYDELARELLLARDAESIRISIQQLREGKGRKASEFFDELHARLLAMKAQQSTGTRA
jgi:PHD/YefM family antitoxin component YafN of YafNO toxin-antitoxin module